MLVFLDLWGMARDMKFDLWELDFRMRVFVMPWSNGGVRGILTSAVGHGLLGVSGMRPSGPGVTPGMARRARLRVGARALF